MIIKTTKSKILASLAVVGTVAAVVALVGLNTNALGDSFNVTGRALQAEAAVPEEDVKLF